MGRGCSSSRTSDGAGRRAGRRLPGTVLVLLLAVVVLNHLPPAWNDPAPVPSWAVSAAQDDRPDRPAMAVVPAGRVTKAPDRVTINVSPGTLKRVIARLRETEAVPAPTTAVVPAVQQKLSERLASLLPLVKLLAVFLLLALLLGLVLFFLRKRKLRSKKSGSDVPAPGSGAATVIDVPDSAPRLPPALAGRYRDVEFIGEGGLARVFRARRREDGETVAVKVPIRFDEATGSHFSRDIFLWQDLVHGNIIRVYSANILPVPYVEMEYAISSLADLPLPLPEERAVEIVRGVASGLAYAHARGIAHRDIKPENVLIGADGTPKITDFGLGKGITDLKKTVAISFSPEYAAPEQAAPGKYGRPGPATDIYHLGLLLSTLLTGTVPARNEGSGLHEAEAIPSWGGRNEGAIRLIIGRCLQARQEDRYGSVGAFIADLDALGTGLSRVFPEE